jgi:hypothetical protein
MQPRAKPGASTSAIVILETRLPHLTCLSLFRWKTGEHLYIGAEPRLSAPM